MRKVELSLVLPCFNEAQHFEKSVFSIVEELNKSKLKFEIIFIEDKSKDDTKKLIANFLRKNKGENFRAIYHQKNTGRGQSVTDGIEKAKADLVGFIDIDCEVSPEYIIKCIKKFSHGYDLISGHRHYQTNISGLIRAIASTFYLSLVQLILGTKLPDTEAGYKFFKREKILKLLPKIRNKGWFWDTEIMIRADRAGWKIGYVPVLFKRKKDKTSTVNLFNDTIEYLVKMLLFRLTLSKEYFVDVVIPKILAELRLKILPISEIDRSLPKKGKIYEIGSGYGSLALNIAKSSYQRSVVALDISKDKIQKVNDQFKLKNLAFVAANALTTNYSDCDAVIMSDFLHHLNFENQIKLLKKTAPKIKNSGVLIVKEIDKHDGIRTILSRFWDFILYPRDKIFYRSKADWFNVLYEFGFKVKAQRAAIWFPGSTWLFICKKRT